MIPSINTIFNYLCGLVSLAVIFYAYMRYKHNYWKRKGVPTAPGVHWFFGHIKDAVYLQKSPGQLMGDLYRSGNDADDMIGIYIFHKPFLIIRNPELIKQITIRDFQTFPNHHFSGKSFKDKLAANNLFNIRYPEWKHLRVKMTPTFTTGKIKKLFHLMLDTADFMKEYLANQFQHGEKMKPVLVTETASKYTTDIISNIAFGLRTNSFTDPPPEFYNKSREAVKITFQRAFRFFFMFFFPNFGKYLGGQILGSSTEYFNNVFWESMNAREESKAKRGDVLDSLIELKNEVQDTTIKFEGPVLTAQSVIFFVAGRESTITTLTFTLGELAKHPEIQTKLRQEIFEKLDKHGMTYEGIQDMKYLFQVISETLRMYPPAPLIDRCSLVDYKVPGTNIVLEKETPLYVPLNGLHYDEKYHPEPLRYNPDRFSEEKKSDMLQCTYMPFGEGPRTCIAMRVGLLQSAVALITILKEYEVSLHPDHSCIVDPRSVFTTPLPGFMLNFTKLAKTE